MPMGTHEKIVLHYGRKFRKTTLALQHAGVS
jgi:hypothetical protein